MNKTIPCLLACVLATGPALAGEVKLSPLSVPEVITEVREKNPEILAAKRRWEAARAKILQEATPDKPRLDIEKMYAPSSGRITDQAAEQAVAVTQSIPFPTSFYFKAGRAAVEAGMAEEAYRAKVLDVLTRARHAFVMLYFSERSLEIYQENADLLRRFSRVAESKYAARKGLQSDALKAQVELTKMLNMTVIAEADRESAAAELNALMGRDADSPIGQPKDPDSKALAEGYEAFKAGALKNRPELREAELASRKAGKTLALARSEFLPDLTATYRRRTDPMRGRTYDGVLGLSLPLWFWKPAAGIRQARLERDMAAAEAEAMRATTLSDIKSAYVKAKTSARLAEIYRTSVLPQAEAALRVAEAGYQADKAGFLDLLDAQRSLLSFRLEYYQIVSDYEARLAELDRVAGREAPARQTR